MPKGVFEQAARLLGASDALREAIGVAQAAPGRAVYDRGWRPTVRAEMGDDAFEAARAEGRALTLERAIEYALAVDAQG